MSDKPLMIVKQSLNFTMIALHPIGLLLFEFLVTVDFLLNQF